MLESLPVPCGPREGISFVGADGLPISFNLVESELIGCVEGFNDDS